MSRKETKELLRQLKGKGAYWNIVGGVQSWSEFVIEQAQIAVLEELREELSGVLITLIDKNSVDVTIKRRINEIKEEK